MLRWFLFFASFSVFFTAAVVVWWNLQKEKERRRLVRNLTSSVSSEAIVRTTVLVETPGPVPGFAGLRPRRYSVRAIRIDRLSKTSFFLVSVAAAVAGFIFGIRFIGTIGVLAPLIGAFVGAGVLRFYRTTFSDKRMAAIEEQFPEALDFLARSIRAGNAFSIALELLAAEIAEPLKSEISKITREMALGAGLDDALQGLIVRVPLLEMRMFVAAVLLQRETGGNLSEVLGKLSMSVRERLRLRGQVKAASGQARLTAMVLTFLPAGTLLMLKLISPAYINTLTDDPVGRNFLGLGIVSQIIGFLVMKKLIKVEV